MKSNIITEPKSKTQTTSDFIGPQQTGTQTDDETAASSHSDKDQKCDHHAHVSKCNYLKQLSIIIREYNDNQKNANEQMYRNICNKYSQNIVQILDNFHHLLAHHKSDEDFKYIYKIFGSCDALKCHNIKRNYRRRRVTINEDHEDTKCNTMTKIELIEEVFDIIHCQFVHGYDIGHRLNKSENATMHDIKDNDEDADEKHNMKYNMKLQRLRQILQRKKAKFDQVIGCSQSAKTNKFVSNLNQISTINSSSNATIKYSYSYPFFYKEKCKDCQVQFTKGWTYADLCVEKHHNTLKEEMINNKICNIHITTWNNKIKKALCLIQTQNAKKSYAWTDDYSIQSYDDPRQFGYVNGSPITENHLIALIIYCSLDKFQYKLRETYRPLNENETMSDVKKRHSNFYHCARTLKEVVQVFGIQYQEGAVKRMYHGINTEMVFDSMSAVMYGVMSTTYVWNVGVQFSEYTGLVIELVPSFYLRYFECEWLSPYASEGELLFAGGFADMHIVNIKNAQYGYEYSHYILSLRVIDHLTKGEKMMIDPADIHKAYSHNIWDAQTLKLKSMSKFNKISCIALIHHELNRNGFNTTTYKAFPNLNDHVDQMLHRICSSKQDLFLNWNAMNTNIVNEIDIDGGYIGYSFLKDLFCNSNYEGIDLHLLEALFPNMISMHLIDLTNIDSKFLKDILAFLQNESTKKFRILRLRLCEKVEWGNMVVQAISYKDQFAEIGFDTKLDLQSSEYSTLQLCRFEYLNQYLKPST